MYDSKEDQIGAGIYWYLKEHDVRTVSHDLFDVVFWDNLRLTSKWSATYAIDVLKDRWPEGEIAIFSDPEAYVWFMPYLKQILNNNRLIHVEHKIAESNWIMYMTNVLTPWEEL